MNTAVKYQETRWNNIGTQISEDIFPSEAYRLISEKKDNGDLVILDVCTPKEFSKAHLENATNLNFFSKAFKSQLNTLDKEKTYFVYCKVGGRSRLAQKQMKKVGFKEVYNIVGGTLLWEEEGLPFASGLEGPSKFAFCKAGCTGFKDTPADLEKMVEMMRRCCGSQDDAIDCSAMGRKKKTIRYTGCDSRSAFRCRSDFG